MIEIKKFHTEVRESMPNFAQTFLWMMLTLVASSYKHDLKLFIYGFFIPYMIYIIGFIMLSAMCIKYKNKTHQQIHKEYVNIFTKIVKAKEHLIIAQKLIGNKDEIKIGKFKVEERTIYINKFFKIDYSHKDMYEILHGQFNDFMDVNLNPNYVEIYTKNYWNK